MYQIKDYPPNIEEIKKHFDVAGMEAKGYSVYFTYGNNIYNPGGKKIDPDFEYHEEIHARQQQEIGGPEIWWDRYIKDIPFRIVQEVEAYGKQVKFLRKRNAKMAQRELSSFATVLSGPLYGNMMTYDEACKALFKMSLQAG